MGDDGRRAGRARRLGEEGVVDRRRQGGPVLAAVAPGEELAALGGREEGESGERQLRCGERGGEEGRHVAEEAHRGPLGEQVGVVGEPQPDLAGIGSLFGDLFGDEAKLEDLPRQVGRGIGRRDGDPEIRAGEPRRPAAEEEQNLERRRAARVARQAQSCEEDLERQVLVRRGGRLRLPYLVDERAVAAVGPRAGAAEQGVAEGTDQPLGLRAAAFDRRADEEILLAADAPEDGGPGGQEERRERRPAPSAQLSQGRGERLRQRAVNLAGEETLRRGAVEVGRQAQDGKRRGQLAPPGLDSGGERIAREVQLLPERRVGVLHGELGERRRPSRGEGLVEHRDLAPEDEARSAVEDDGVGGEEPGVPIRREAHESDAQEGLRHDVERAPPLLGGEASDLGPPRRLRQAGEVNERQRPGPGGADGGLRHAVRRGEGGAQDLVPADHLVERAGEEGGGERACEIDGVEEVAGCRAGVDLVEEPHPLLGKGERATHGGSRQQVGGAFRRGSHDPTASHGGGPAGYCPPPSVAMTLQPPIQAARASLAPKG